MRATQAHGGIPLAPVRTRSRTVSAVPESSPSAPAGSGSGGGGQASSDASVPWYRHRVFLGSAAALITLVSVIGIYVQQQGKAQQQAEELADPASPSGLVLASQATGTALASVGKVTGLAQPCTSWLLNTGAAGDSKAVAVTTGVFIPWTLPPVISGFIVTGHLSGSVMQILNLLIGAMLYLPFMRIVDKQYRAAEMSTVTQTDTTLAKQE